MTEASTTTEQSAPDATPQQPRPCDWDDDLPGDDVECGDEDGENRPEAVFYVAWEQSDGNEPELEQRWTEEYHLCQGHFEALALSYMNKGRWGLTAGRIKAAPRSPTS